MEFPDEATVSAVLDPVELPPFHEVRYDPPTPELDDVPGAAREAVDALAVEDLPADATVAVGVGSRGITDLAPVVEAVVDRLRELGLDPVVVPAMGSHGGATAEGQREVLAALGITTESLDCPIDARMETVVLGESDLGSPVHFAVAATEADATMVVNRVKAHTNFTGPFESGLAKMTAVGLGKQVGASAVHERALVEGYVPVVESAFDVIREAVDLLGGVAIVENFEDRTAEIEGLRARDIPEAEADLLERAYEYMPTLPYEDLDVLVVERIGKDVSGAGMDTNVIGRYQVLNAEEPETPHIKRILVLGLTEATHGNGQGIGLADLTTVDVVEELDLDQVYANALTSSSFSKARLPLALPTDELALTAAVSGVGPYDPETARIAWIRDTGHLSEFRVSPALARDPPEHVEVVGRSRLAFEDGEARFEPVE
ncbi:MAG: lactate racemase domain-containing protein [Haloarculaceae archaeon]